MNWIDVEVRFWFCDVDHRFLFGFLVRRFLFPTEVGHLVQNFVIFRRPVMLRLLILGGSFFSGGSLFCGGSVVLPPSARDAIVVSGSTKDNDRILPMIVRATESVLPLPLAVFD